MGNFIEMKRSSKPLRCQREFVRMLIFPKYRNSINKKGNNPKIAALYNYYKQGRDQKSTSLRFLSTIMPLVLTGCLTVNGFSALNCKMTSTPSPLTVCLLPTLVNVG